MEQGSEDELAIERGQQSAHISLVFEAAVKRVFRNYAVEMTRPEGGARSLLHIRLTADGLAFPVGWADPYDGTAELYTLGKTLARSKRTWGRERVLPPMEYSRFLEIAKPVLEDFGMSVTIVAYIPDEVEVDEAADAKVAEALSRESSPSSRPRTNTFPYLDLRSERSGRGVPNSTSERGAASSSNKAK